MAEERRNVTIVINGKEVTNTIASINRAYRSQRKELNGLTRGTKEYNQKVREIRRTKGILDNHRAQIRGVKREYSGATRGAGKFSSTIGGGLKSSLGAIASPIGIAAAGIAGLIGGMVSGVSKIRQFNVALDELKAITGVSTDEILQYKDAAIETSAAVGMSAVEVVNAYKLVGSARPQLLANRDALTDFTQKAIVLSQATKDELGPTVAALTNIMAANGAKTSEATRFINALAAGSQKGSKPVGFIADALQKVGPAANSANIELEKQIAIVEVLGEKGIPVAEKAGTSFRNILLELQKDTSNYVNGQFDMNLALENLQPIMNDSVALTDRFGKQNVVAAQILAQNVGRVNELTEAVTGTNTAYEQQATNQDNLDSALKRLGAKWDALILQFSEGEGILVFIVDFLGDHLTVLGEFMSILGELFGEVYDALAELVSELFSFIDFSAEGVEMIDLLRMAMRAIIAPIKMVVAMFVTFIDTIRFMNRQSRALLVQMVNYFGDWYNDIVAIMNKIPGVEIEGEFKPMPVEDVDWSSYKDKVKENFNGVFEVAPVVDTDASVDLSTNTTGGGGDATGGGERVVSGVMEKIDTLGIDNVENPELLAHQLLLESKAALDEEFIANNEEMTNESREKLNQLEMDRAQALASFKQDMAKLAVDTGAQLIANGIQASEQREFASLELKREQGLITEAEFEAQKEQIQRKAFRKKQTLDIAQAAINGALAITKVTAQTGVGAPFVIPGIIAQTAAQIAIIASQKYRDGGMYSNPLPGRSHANGGNPILDPNTGAKIGEIEQGEFIIRKSRVTASTLPLLRAINGGGIPQVDFGRHQAYMKFERGGTFETPEESNNGTDTAMMEATLQAINEQTKAINNWQRNFQVSMKYNQIETADERTSTVRKIANVRA